MSLTIKYSDPKGIEEPAVTYSLSSNVRYGALALSMSASVGEPDVSTVEIEDPGGLINLVGLRAFDVRETSAPSNNQVIGRFVIQKRKYARSPERGLITGADRLITADLTDYNWHLGKRVFTDSDAKRPAETPGDRIRWLLNRAAHINLNDMGHVTYPSSPTLEANDYRGQRPTDLLADCCIEGGYNYWVDYNEALGKPELFFMDPDGTDYGSSVTISNNLADVDGSTCFAPYIDAELDRSPDKIAFGVLVAYAKGYVYVRNDTVAEQYAKLDQTAPMANVKTSTRARRIGNKFLADNDEENDVLTCAIKVPAAQVNDIRHGHRIQVKFTHLPGYESFRWCRVTKRSVLQDEEGGHDYYRIVLEMVPQGNACTAPSIVQWGFAGTILNAPFSVVLDAAPTEGNTLLALCWSKSDGWYPASISGVTSWTLDEAGTAEDLAQYGGPGAPARLVTYSRVAGAGESATVTMTPTDLGAMDALMVIEVRGAASRTSDSTNGTLFHGDTRTMSSVVTAPSLMIVAWAMQRTTYAPADSVSGNSVTELRDAYIGVGTGSEAPHIWVAHKEASEAGTLSIAGSPADNPNLDRWAVFSVAYTFDPSGC